MADTNKGVKFTRNELARQLFTYERIHDCLVGAPAMKGLLPAEPWYLTGPLTGAHANGLYFGADRRQRYIPKPNPTDDSRENQIRYDQYVNRAVWYNVPSRTVQGLVGQVFLRDPEAEIPNTLDPVKADADGAGNSLIQVAKQAVRGMVAYGRGGFLVDYPSTTAAVPTADATGSTGANVVLSMVVLRECLYGQGEDDFELIAYDQYRVLKLSPDGKHVGEVWSNYDAEKGTAEGEVKMLNAYTPLDSSGSPYDSKIPFSFIGAEQNTAVMQKAPMDDLCEIAVGHFRNSADYEESIYYTGQPTLVMTGLTEDWAKEILGGKVFLGSRGGLPLPTGATAALLEPTANSLVAQAMKDKELQMTAIGAKLVQEVKASRTATETMINTTSESSVPVISYNR
jgi:hypothetical protein